MKRRDKSQKSLFFDTPTTDDDILDAFANTEEWLSRKMIAERVARVKSPSMIARIESLVDRECLERQGYQLPNGAVMLLYRRREECERGFQTHAE